MAKLRVHNFAMSIDGYGAGPDQGPDHPLGVDGHRLLRGRTGEEVGRLGGFGRLVRSLCLRPSRRPKIIGRADYRKRGKDKRPPPTTPADHAHNPPPEPI